MKWECWSQLYLEKYCIAQGLRPKTISAYAATLSKFRSWVLQKHGENISPEVVTTNHVLDYVTHLREVRRNGHSAVNTQVVTLRGFYKALVALEAIHPNQNPTVRLPRMKAPKRKFRETLSKDEVTRVINKPRTDTILGLRDRAILILLYGTGIRASECADIRERDIDFIGLTVRVIGKGGNQRTIPLNKDVVSALQQYGLARGPVESDRHFFKTRKGRGTTRAVIYDRVRKISQKARVPKRVTPHLLRHTFATHLVRLGEKLVILKELLGHRQLSSTEVYLHMTGEDLRKAVDRHPIEGLISSMKNYLPGVKLRFQYPPGQRFAFNS